jgi:hypothetical protein
MDSEQFTQLLQTALSSVDDNKEKLSNNDYLIITNNLNNLHKLMSNNFYEVTYITMEYNRCGVNSINSIPKRRKAIIRLSTEEYEHIKTKLIQTNGFLPNCCDAILEGVKDRLNIPLSQEFNCIYTSASINDSDIVDDLTDRTLEVNLFHRVIFLNVIKL